jgi:hypothetical protein
MKEDTKPPAATPASAPPASPALYEVTVPGPIKVGAVIASQGARLRLTPQQADALNTAQPGTVRFLGI